MLCLNKLYTKEEIQDEFGLYDEKASNLIRKLEQMGYTATGNGKKGKNYRIIINSLPQMNEIMEIFKKMGLQYSENNLNKILQLLSSLGTEANYSFRSLENYNYFTDKTIKKYLEIFKSMGLIKMELTGDIYYATKKRILTVEEHSYTDEELERQDYYYVIDVKRISEEDYNRATKAYLEFLEAHKNDEDMVEDEIEFYAQKEKRSVLDKWNAKKNSGERFIINQDYPQYDYFIPLLDQKDKKGYQRVKKGNYYEDEIAWEERVERWEEEKRLRKEAIENYKKVLKQMELLKSMLSETQLQEFERMIEKEEVENE